MQAEILDAYGKLGVEMLKQAVAPYSATGETERSIRYESGLFNLRLLARFGFHAIETGRGPRKNNTYEGFDNKMFDYMQARGIGGDLSDKKRRQLARFFTWRINKEGDALFKKGGREVYSDKLDAFIRELEQALIKDFAKSFLTSIKNSFNGTVSTI